MEENTKGPIVQGPGTMNLSQREQNGISVHPAVSVHYFFTLSPLMDSLEESMFFLSREPTTA